jgi:hypothetical protein
MLAPLSLLGDDVFHFSFFTFHFSFVLWGWRLAYQKKCYLCTLLKNTETYGKSG